MQQRNDALPYRRVSVEVVVPVHNEEAALRNGIAILRDYLTTYFPYRWSVVIVDNGSTDRTLAVAREIAAAHPHVSVLHLEGKGRGRALKYLQADIGAWRPPARVKRAREAPPKSSTEES